MKKKMFLGRVTKLLSIALCFAMLVSVFANLSNPLVAAAGEIQIWNGTTASSLSGSGTQADPYRISNGAELKYLVTRTASQTSGKYYVITQDIYLNNPATITYNADGFATDFDGINWPSGTKTDYAVNTFGVFSGTIDGQGHKIVGMYNKNALGGCWGVFQSLGANAVVKNINVDSVYYNRVAYKDWQKESSYISGIAGTAAGSNITISGCTVYRSTFTEQQPGYIHFGGIIGKCESYSGIVISNCGVNVSASVNTGNSYLIGGITANGKANVTAALKVSNCWTNIYPAGHSNINNNGRASYTNCYTLNSNSHAQAAIAPAGIKKVSGSVIGADAISTMPDLGWGEGWDLVTGGLPTPRNTEAAAAIEIWDGTNSAPTEGSGTEEDPYIISTGAHLAYIATAGADATSGKYYKISKDIYLNDPTKYTYDANGYANKPSAYQNCWPSGGYGNYTLVDATFSGHLDGAGHKIFGLYNDWAPNGHWALFAHLGGGSSVKNVNLDSIYYQPDGRTDWNESVSYLTSSIASTVDGNFVTISGCTVTRATYNDSGSWKLCGGLVGNLYDYAEISFTNCSYDANVIGGAYGARWGIYYDAYNGRNAVYVKDSWSNQSLYWLNSTKHVVFENCYTLSDVVDDGIESISSYVITQLVGEAAKTAMPKLGWGYTWKTVYGAAPQVACENFDTSWKATGDGTRANPYKIATANTLFNAIYTATVLESEKYAGKFFELQNDIVVNDSPSLAFPIYKNTRKWFSKTGGSGFRAIFDGKGHTISGLYGVNTVGGGMVGLIPTLSDGGIVANINIENSYFTSEGDTWSGAGAVVGGLGDYAKGKIYGCHIAEDVIIKGDENSYVGGVIGMSNRGGTDLRIAYCSSAADVEGKYVGIITAGGWDVANTTLAHCLAIGGSAISADKATTFDVCEKNVENVSLDTAKSSTVSALGLDSAAWVKAEGAVPTTCYMQIAWTGKADASFDGEGTQTNPFKIYTPEQLWAAISTTAGDLTEGHLSTIAIELMNDIVLTDTSVSGWQYLASNWSTPSNFEFSGNIYGNGRTVIGLYSSSSQASGFICQASAKTTVSNLHLEDAHISGQIPGGILGYVLGGSCVVDGCSVVDSVITRTTGSPYESGAIVGTAVSALSVKNSFSLNNTGITKGIVGKAWGSGTSVISNCYSAGAPAYIDVVGATPTNVYQIGVSGEVANGTTTVTSYNEMTGLFSDTENVWYQAYGLAPQLVNKGLNFLRPDINGNGVRDDLDATSLAALRSYLLSIAGYELDNAMGNVNGDSASGKDIVDIRDLVHIKKCIAEDKETSKIEHEKAAEYDYSTDNLPISDKDTYTLKWADEFDNAATSHNQFDSNMWVNTTNMGGLHDAKQYAENTTVENGQLKLRTYKIAENMPGDYPDVYSIPYSCATSSTMNYRYGYVEMRARIPSANHSWASLWSLTATEDNPIYSNTNANLGSTNVHYDTSTNYTIELDVFEICGSSSLVPNMHVWPKSDTSGTHRSVGSNGKAQIEDNSWHTIGFEWTPSKIVMYCDGTAYQTYDISASYWSWSSATNWYVHKNTFKAALKSPIYLILNNHLFTKNTREVLWNSGSLDDSAYAVGDMVTEYVVDYVRLYQSSLHDNQFYAVNPYNGQ